MEAGLALLVTSLVVLLASYRSFPASSVSTRIQRAWIHDQSSAEGEPKGRLARCISVRAS
jgi:hypothetical protein